MKKGLKKLKAKKKYLEEDPVATPQSSTASLEGADTTGPSVSQISAEAVEGGRFERWEDLSIPPLRLLLLLEFAEPHGSLTPQSSAAGVLLLLAEDAARPPPLLTVPVPQSSAAGVLGLEDQESPPLAAPQ